MLGCSFWKSLAAAWVACPSVPRPAEANTTVWFAFAGVLELVVLPPPHAAATSAMAASAPPSRQRLARYPGP